LRQELMMPYRLVVPASSSEVPAWPGATRTVVSPVLGRAGRDGPVRAVVEVWGDPDTLRAIPDGYPVATGPGVPVPARHGERVVIAGEPEAGTAKLSYWITRRSELSVAEFDRYWREDHARIAVQIPHVLRYVQALREGDGRGHDGIAEMWWTDVPTQQEAMRSEQLAAAVADEARFIDHDHVMVLVSSWATGVAG
jgi:uncharacterized protein (TIGR02118 family)